MSGEALAFDRVIVASAGATRTLSVEQFLALPVDEVVRLVLGREVEFYCGDTPVRRAEALRSLRCHRASD